MYWGYLSKTVSIKTVSEDLKRGVFEVEGLFAGYGLNHPDHRKIVTASNDEAVMRSFSAIRS